MRLCHFQTHIQSPNILSVQEDLRQISFADFWQDVCSQANVIQHLDTEQYALWENDSYTFLVLFFATLLANKQLLLAPNRVKDLELELVEQGIHFLTRQQISEHSQDFENNFTLQQLQFDDLFLNQAQVYFYTSGSTGQPKKIPRTLRQLLNEVQGLDQSFDLAENSIAIATVIVNPIKNRYNDDMSYPIHFRKKILAKLEEGYSIREVAQQFEIDKNTIVEWKKRIEIKRTRPRKPSKVDDDALRADVDKYPDDFHYERAARFGCGKSTIGDALKRLKITVKKRPYATRKQKQNLENNT